MLPVDEPERKAKLSYGGPAITEIWAWIVKDQHGQEAFCRSPWHETMPLMGPDRENIDTPVMAAWARDYYAKFDMTVELRRFLLA